MTRPQPFDHDQHLFQPPDAATRGMPAVALCIAAAAALALASCGGGGSDAPAVTSNAAAPAVAVSPSQASAGTPASAGATPVTGKGNANADGAAAGTAPAAGNGAANNAANSAVNNPAGGSGGIAPPPPAQLADFAFYRLGSVGPAGTASLRGDLLAIDGRQSAPASLVAGACNGGSAFSQCASAASASVFTLCSSDGGNGPDTDRVRGRYVLFDPAAERITDIAVLRNLSFSGFENCGQDNVGAQPKSAPSATLSFNASGDLTLTRYDQNPARSSSLPGYFVSLDSDTVSGGQSARFTLYRSNGRYLIIATSLPVAGVSAADPGTLIAFVQN